MAEYKGIKGFQVQTRSEDPGPTEAQPGDFYYNSSTGQFKTINAGGAPIGTWSSGGNLNTARSYLAGFGSQTSAIAATGLVTTISTATEQYNGSSWSEIAEVNSGFNHRAGAGITAPNGILIGGASPSPSPRGRNVVEVWDGSSWTEVAEIGAARYGIAASGTSTAALGSGGYDYPGGIGNVGLTESWNGSAWTELNDLNSARHYGSQVGPYTAALRAGGYPTPTKALTESWDGTSWTEVGDMNTGRPGICSGSGDQTSMIVAGVPNATPAALVEAWDGTSWAEVAENATQRQSLAGGRVSSTAAVIFGGQRPGSPERKNETEEWNAAEFEIKTVTTS